MISNKICKKCNQLLEISMFSPCKNTKDGYENKCRKCRREQRPRYDLICEHCRKNFVSEKSEAKFCSQNCNAQSRKKQLSIPCSYCGSSLNRPPSLINNFEYVYCNQDCRTLHLKELMKGKGNPNYNRVKTNCGFCQKEFYEIPYKINNQKHVYCSYSCYVKHRSFLMAGELRTIKVRITVTCEVCKKKIKRKPSVAKRSKKHYCSRDCYNKALTELNYNRKSGEIVPCAICAKDVYVTEWYKSTRQRIYCSHECKDKGWSLFFSGSNHPNWQEDKSYNERVKERLLEGYKTWRTAVYERDNYICQCCGYDKGKVLVAHHKNGYDKFPEQRFDVNNGVTLCKSCHKEFHGIYGYGGNTESQFSEWINTRMEVKKTGNIDISLMIKESRVLAKKRAMELFSERQKNGLTINEISQETGISRAYIYILAKKENFKS